MRVPQMQTGDEFLDAVADRLFFNRECHIALRSEHPDLGQVAKSVGRDVARDEDRARRIDNHRAAARELGCLLAALGGAALMRAVMDWAEDRYGVAVASWISRTWTGIPTKPGDGELWP
jgi:hypothetical protein